jgi:spermidine/putrescine transport system ATP-binding protein
MQISRAGTPTEGENAISGVVTDASYIGVSTQYLVELPWGQEVSVFSQNLSTDGPLSRADAVVLHWNPAHTFALDAMQDAEAGAEKVQGDE